ncbi:hypothetical protein HYPSUDRAFT_209869 [Hypholoma sublateritium FD-334 SS-4]|uniref:Integrase core domain-containing protein n=1 Tax=Hypholoma sublateritium (strain FD-334 SS-4) TaxID=945553 RepID=A0A0D2NWZ0_HYPSF|nr:hypothetical protein HYPSUDRAFT_209869 [Hypholoma sublateritium FD-334 SS-4]
MESEVQRVCLFLTYHKRIQHSLDETVASWNLHKVRTAGNKTPLALYQLSREKAINQGYWTGDPGDDVTDISENYGEDPNEAYSPADELAEDPNAADNRDFENDVEMEREAGIFPSERHLRSTFGMRGEQHRFSSQHRSSTLPTVLTPPESIPELTLVL